MKDVLFTGKWSCYDGLTADQIGEKAAAKNAYLVDIETYDTDSQRLFSAVMMSNPGLAWGWYFGLTPGDLATKFAENQAVPTRLITHGQGQNRTFGALIERREGQSSWWYYGQTADQLSQLMGQHDAAPQDILAYLENGELRFAAILYPRNGAAYWWYFGLTPDELAAKLRENNAAPFRIRAYETPAGIRYVAVLVPQTEPFWWYFGQDMARIKELARGHCAYVSDLTTYIDGGRRLFTCILKQKPQLPTELDDWTELAKPPTYCADLLIVTSAELRASVSELVTHKRATGLRTTVVTMPTITQQGVGEDDAEKLKRVIWDAYHIMGVKYVLLAGDAKHVPVRHRCVVHPWSETLPIAQTWNATDYYYGNLYDGDEDVFATWASEHPAPGVYNRQVWGRSPWEANPDSVAGRPVVAVGRIPAAQPSEMRNYTQKVKTHETTSAAIAGSKCLAASKFYPGSAQLLDVIDAAANGLPGQGQTLRLAMRFDEADTLPAGWQRVAGNDELFKAFAAKQWVIYVGHGTDDRWDNHFAAWQIAGQLPNTHNFPIVVAASCETARFSPNLPWDAVGTGYPYKDRFGVDHQFINPGDAPGPIEDVFHGPVERPVDLPAPAPYDYFAPLVGRASLANSMLFCSTSAVTPTGAIGYIGDTVGMDNGPSTEFGAAVLRAYAAGPSLRLGDVWLRAQQDYFNAHLPAHVRFDVNFAHPRIFLSIIQLLGDPSLRLSGAV